MPRLRCTETGSLYSESQDIDSLTLQAADCLREAASRKLDGLARLHMDGRALVSDGLVRNVEVNPTVACSFRPLPILRVQSRQLSSRVFVRHAWFARTVSSAGIAMSQRARGEA